MGCYDVSFFQSDIVWSSVSLSCISLILSERLFIHKLLLDAITEEISKARKHIDDCVIPFGERFGFLSDLPGITRMLLIDFRIFLIQLLLAAKELLEIINVVNIVNANASSCPGSQSRIMFLVICYRHPFFVNY